METELGTIVNSPLQLEEVRIVESFIKVPENSNFGELNLKMGLGSSFKLTPKDTSLYSYILNLEFKGIINEDQNELIVVKTKGHFTFDLNKLPEKARKQKTVINLLSYNAPALVFPYIRSYVASMTAMAGDFAIMLPTLNLTPTGNNIKERLEQDEVLQAMQGLD